MEYVFSSVYRPTPSVPGLTAISEAKAPQHQICAHSVHVFLAKSLRPHTHNRAPQQPDRHGRPIHGPVLRAGPRAPLQAYHHRGHRHPTHRHFGPCLRRRRRRGRAGRRGGRGEPGVGLLPGRGPRRAGGDRGAGDRGAARVLRPPGGAEGDRAEERGGAARVPRVGAHQERQGLEGGVRPRRARAAAAGGGNRDRWRGRVREQVARGPARLQGGAGGVHESHGRAGVQAAGAAGPEPEPEARPAARLLQAPHHVLPPQPLPSLPEPGPRARRGPAQGPRRPDDPVPGRRRRARRPAALRQRVGPCRVRPRLLHRQRRRHRAGVEQRPVRERGAPGVGEPGDGEVLHALLLQPGGRRRRGAAGGAGGRGGGRRPAQVQRVQLGGILQHKAQRQLQEAGRGEPPDRALQEGPRSVAGLRTDPCPGEETGRCLLLPRDDRHRVAVSGRTSNLIVRAEQQNIYTARQEAFNEIIII